MVVNVGLYEVPELALNLLYLTYDAKIGDIL